MTVTSNIHVGLAVWAISHAYVLTNRVSNGGNAYECTVPGTSAGSGGPSGTTSDVTDGTVHWKWLSAITYTTLAAWQADTTNFPATLTQPVVGLLWNDGTIAIPAASTFFHLTGHTTSTTNTITLKCAPGESFRDKMAGQATALAASAANGVSFTFSATTPGGVNYFWISDNNVIFEGLQFIDPLSTSNSTLLAADGTGVIIRDCIFNGFGQTGGATIIGYTAAGAVNFINLLVVDHAASPSTGAAVMALDSNPCNIVNCTFVGVNAPTGSQCILQQASAGAAVFKNNIVMGYAAANAITCSGVGTVTSDHSVFSAASLTGTGVTTGTGNLFSKTAANQFVSATVDFRIKITADAYNAGTPDTTDNPSSDDIARTTRPQGTLWDVGCWEFEVSFLPPPPIMIQLRM